jgi:hypothetical protein
LFIAMIHLVYLLKSEQYDGYYFSHTKDVENWLKEYNWGKVISTKVRVPFCWILFNFWKGSFAYSLNKINNNLYTLSYIYGCNSQNVITTCILSSPLLSLSNSQNLICRKLVYPSCQNIRWVIPNWMRKFQPKSTLIGIWVKLN